MVSEKDKKSPDGHRKRVRAKIIANGTKNLSDIDLLEAFLFYVIPRKDVRPQAEILINEYGSFENVLKADNDEIANKISLKSDSLVVFSLLREAIERASSFESDKNILDGGRIKDFLLELFKGKEAETVYALYFDEDGGYLGRQSIFRGGISSVRFSLRKITEGVIRVGGKAVILAHNHPSDILVPSGEDLFSTKRIATHLAANEITLIEHYIVGTNEVVGILNFK